MKAVAKHVDEWLSEPSFEEPELYAKFVLDNARKPAWFKFGVAKWMRQFKLFCIYEGKCYRVTGASRLGDVWLATDFDRELGYDHRVDVEDCSDWSPEPITPKRRKRQAGTATLAPICISMLVMLLALTCLSPGGYEGVVRTVGQLVELFGEVGSRLCEVAK